MHQNHSKANIKLRLLQEQSNIRSNTINSSVWSIWASKNLCNTFSSTQLIVVTGRNNPDQEFNMQWQERTLDLTCWLTQFQWYPRTRTHKHKGSHMTTWATNQGAQLLWNDKSIAPTCWIAPCNNLSLASLGMSPWRPWEPPQNEQISKFF